MARRRFFVPAVRQGAAELTGDDAQHLTRVLRVEAGQKYEISDNTDVYLAEVETARKSLVVFKTFEKLPPEPARVEIHLLLALIKFDSFEWALEKATELGVTQIVPVLAERSEHGLERAVPKRRERWQRILLESSQQCRRAHLPVLGELTRYKDVVTAAEGYRYVLDELPGTRPLLQRLPETRQADDLVSLLVGPEGGWADPERAAMETGRWRAVSVGPYILRAETAAMTAVALITNAWL